MQKGFATVSFLVATVLVILLIAGLLISGRGPWNTPSDEVVACTMDAKLCPDGSYVGRIPPICEFAPCPDENGDNDKESSNETILETRVYTNTEYGFQLSYPDSYKALDDPDSLYGWPDALVLFYKGGQAYDVVVEVWDTKDQYLQKYLDDSGIYVHELNGKHITILDNSYDPENREIIESFATLQKTNEN